MPKKVDFRVCLCEECKRTWQYFIHYNGHKDFEYLEDFPRYGLERKNCPGCDVKLRNLLDNRLKKELLNGRICARKRKELLQI